MGLSDLFRRKDESDTVGAVSDRASTFPTKSLARFLSALKTREQPVLLDLGPVVGQNVNFFEEQLGCKIFVEDILADSDRHVRQQALGELPVFLGRRFPQADGSIDGILCWDVFDFLDRAAGKALAAQFARILRPEGALLAMFGASTPESGPAFYTKRIVVDEATLSHRLYPAARGKQPPLPNRDIIRMFEPLRVVEQVLLKTNVREVLFRKPAAA